MLTTPNREYNVMWETCRPGSSGTPTTASSGPGRSSRTGQTGVAERFGYTVRFLPVGPEHAELGSPTQMGVFERG